MAFKFSHLNILLVLLWLTLLLLLFHSHYIFNTSQKQITEITTLPSLHHHHSLIFRRRGGRKTLAIKFDFSPILKNHHHHRSETDPEGTEIDPRYGVEKRTVPTGPDRDHH
ncbi:hypothetical protein K1719_033093 [Acacia pycnantha]|nr:hypothetical protein K1719_033093 [Acacia pycnantha]